jgi:glycosyltransferase involved in cell wall biosynthesis
VLPEIDGARLRSIYSNMKIAMYNLTTTVKTGGIETFNWKVGAELESRGHEVHMFGGKGDRREPHPDTVYTFPYLDRRYFPKFGKRFRKFAERWSMARTVVSALKQGSYDVIYLSKPHDLPWAVRAARKAGSRCFLSVGGTEFFPGYARLVRRLAWFTACSAYTADRIEEYCGVRPFVLYNGVDVDVFRPTARKVEIKDRLGIPEKSRVLISVGRLVKWKGIHVAIEALAKLGRQFTDVYYLVVGEGNYREELKACARAAGVDSKVMLLGDVSHAQVPSYISLADIAVLPSIEPEAFGIAAAEAMACGIPVVGSNIGGIPEVLGNTGRLCAPNDADALTEAIGELLANPAQIRALGERARQRIKHNFTWKHVVDRIEEHGIGAL